jgi:hypothetical protein
MKKRLTAMALCAAMLLGMCGCGSIFDKEYSSVTDYVAAGDSSSDGKDTVRNYYALKQAILRLVDARKESGVVAFGEYDGDISTDLKSACWELRTQNALCAYCVESISYDLNHIVSYDEATMHIAYSRSQQDIDQVVTVSYSTDIKDYLADAINALGKRVVLLVNNSALDEEGVKALVSGDIYGGSAVRRFPAADHGVHVQRLGAPAAFRHRPQLRRGGRHRELRKRSCWARRRTPGPRPARTRSRPRRR